MSTTPDGSTPKPANQASGSSSQQVTLTPEVMSSLKISKLFRTYNEAGSQFTSLSFDDKGELVITSAQDETLQLFSCKTGKHLKQLFSKKYGVHLARFTHRSSSVIYASTKEDDALRYVSLHDNSYLSYFKGHKKRVTSLEMSPVNDTFLSSSIDDTVRLWDLRAKVCQGLLNIAGHPTVAYDPSGSVFIVVLNYKNTILWYDLRNFDKDPFLTSHIEDPLLGRSFVPSRKPTLTSAKFSTDSQNPHVLVGTSGDVHYVLDGFEGTIKARLTGHTGLENVDPASPTTGILASGEELSWTPDSRFVVSGSTDGKVHVWDVNPPTDSQAYSLPSYQSRGPECTLSPLKTYDGHQGGICRAVGFNHRLGMMVTAGSELAFWLPDNREGGAPPTSASTPLVSTPNNGMEVDAA